MALMELPPFAVVFPHTAVTLLFLSYCVEYIFFCFFAEHDDVTVNSDH